MAYNAILDLELTSDDQSDTGLPLDALVNSRVTVHCHRSTVVKGVILHIDCNVNVILVDCEIIKTTKIDGIKHVTRKNDPLLLIPASLIKAIKVIESLNNYDIQEYVTSLDN